MRVYIASDQHLEFRRPGREEDYLSKVPPLDAKVAIVAGDFDVMFREQALDNLRRFLRFLRRGLLRPRQPRLLRVFRSTDRRAPGQPERAHT
jgi:hypothetical protein